MANHENIGVVLAGGIGARLSSTQKKQYLELNGKECIAYVIEAFQQAEKCDEVVVVENEEQYLEGYVHNKYGVHTCCGGNTRNQSIYNGLKYIDEHFPNCKKVVLHDGARPFIRPDIVDDYMDMLDEYECMANSLDITDGIGKRMNTEAIREEYYISQTPEGFRFRPFFEAFDPEAPIIALTHHLPPDAKMGHYKKFPYNLKLTFKEDLFVAEALLKAGFKEFMRDIKEERYPEE